MMNALATMGLITCFAATIVLLDWLARRKEGPSKRTPSA